MRDHLGTLRLETGASGEVTGRHDFYLFGTEVPGPGGEVATKGSRKRYTGHERDAGTRLDYMLARYYGGAPGTFAAVDPAVESINPENTQTWNRIGYVLANPVRNIDPDGRWTQDAEEAYWRAMVGEVVAAVGGLVESAHAAIAGAGAAAGASDPVGSVTVGQGTPITTNTKGEVEPGVGVDLGPAGSARYSRGRDGEEKLTYSVGPATFNDQGRVGGRIPIVPGKASASLTVDGKAMVEAAEAAAAEERESSVGARIRRFGQRLRRQGLKGIWRQSREPDD